MKNEKFRVVIAPDEVDALIEVFYNCPPAVYFKKLSAAQIKSLAKMAKKLEIAQAQDEIERMEQNP